MSAASKYQHNRMKAGIMAAAAQSGESGEQRQRSSKSKHGEDNQAAKGDRQHGMAYDNNSGGIGVINAKASRK